MGPWLVAQLIQCVHSGVLETLDNLLTVQDTKIFVIILDTTWQRSFTRRKTCLLKEVSRMDRLDEDHHVGQTALTTIENYFSEREENGIILPVLDQDHVKDVSCHHKQLSICPSPKPNGLRPQV
ncbi:hypothetical protein GH733_001706 [Mirounga leonina]|nr:hypothetical protein GH733_001706 [Mirounga leonina]